MMDEASDKTKTFFCVLYSKQRRSILIAQVSHNGVNVRQVKAICQLMLLCGEICTVVVLETSKLVVCTVMAFYPTLWIILVGVGVLAWLETVVSAFFLCYTLSPRHLPKLGSKRAF